MADEPADSALGYIAAAILSVVALLAPLEVSAVDLKVTDATGSTVEVRKACLDYTKFEGLTLVPVQEECEAVRVFQGVARPKVPWSRIVRVAILGPRRSDRLRGEIHLVDGKKLQVELEYPLEGLKGETDLGKYEIKIDQLRAIERVR